MPEHDLHNHVINEGFVDEWLIEQHKVQRHIFLLELVFNVCNIRTPEALFMSLAVSTASTLELP